MLLASAIVLLAVLITAIKYALPFADEYKTHIESYVLTNFGADVTIGEIGASWQTSGPVVELYDLQLQASPQAPLDIQIRETQLKVNFWQSIIQQRFVSESFVLDGIQSKINSEVFYKVRPSSDGSELIDKLSHLFLSQLHTFKLLNSEIQVVHKDGRKQAYQLSSLNWINDGNRHQANGTVFVDGFSNNSISFIADLYGQRRESIFGDVYFEASAMDVSPWLAQLINEHVTLSSTQANFKAWGKIENGLVSDILVDVLDTGINWQQAEKEKHLSIKSARVHWKKANENWQVFANNVQLQTEQQEYPAFQFSFNVENDKNTKQLNLGNVELQGISQLLSLFSATNQLEFLTKGTLGGELKHLQMLWDKDNKVSAVTRIDSLQLEPHANKKQAYLGFKGLTLDGYWHDSQGWFELSGKNGQLETKDTFSDVIDYQQLALHTHIDLTHSLPVISLPKVSFSNDEVTVDLAAQFIQSEQGLLSLYGEIKGPSQGAIHQYLPRYLLSDDTYDYLNAGIQQGRGELTQLLLFGGVSELLQPKKAQFQVKSQLRDGIFKFAPDWPQVENLDAELWVDAKNLKILAQRGEFSGLTINNDLIVDIPLALDETIVQILLTPEQLEFSEFHSLVENTPLDTVLGDVFDFVKLEGQGTAVVNLTIPVSGEEEVIAQGTVLTAGAQVHLPDLDLTVTDVASIVNFKNEQVELQAQSGKVFGLPISFDLTGGQVGDNYQLDINTLADWRQEQIEQLYPNKLNAYFDGLISSELAIKVNIEEKGYQYYVDGKADLTQASYDISTPLTKKLGTPAFVDISVLGDENTNDFNFSLDSELFFTAILDNELSRFSQANLTIGSDETLLPEQGFDIKLEMEQAEFEPTLAFVIDLIDTIDSQSESAQTAATNDNSRSVIDAPHHIYGNIQNLTILEQEWQNVSLDGRPEDSAWLFSVGAKQTLTQVRVHNDVKQQGIDIRSTFLQIEVPETPENEIVPVEPVLPQPPKLRDSAGLIRSLPPIQFFCDSCFYNQKPLGKVELLTHSNGPELVIEKATLQYKRNQVNLTGKWIGDSGEGRTQLSGAITSRYFGDWLLEYGLNTGIKESNAGIDLNLGWKSAPFLFGYETLNGNAKFKLGEGYFSEISDQGARLVSLLSIDSLYRKLKLDFNDIFEKGLFYNDLKGNVVVRDGVAYSDNIKMDGVSGNMEMKGYTNLNTDALEYNVSFAPNLTSSLGVLTWVAAANPLTIIGAFALDKILEEEGALAEIQMEITGTLKEPVVKEVKRFKKKVNMPTEQEIEAFRKVHPLPTPGDE